VGSVAKGKPKALRAFIVRRTGEALGTPSGPPSLRSGVLRQALPGLSNPERGFSSAPPSNKKGHPFGQPF